MNSFNGKNMLEKQQKISNGVKKSDLIASSIIGFALGVLFLILAYTTITAVTPLVAKPPVYYWAALILLPLISALGMFMVSDLRGKLSGKFTWLFQFYKFGLVGTLNTMIDLALLNGFIVLTEITIGWQFSVFKGASFSVAVINSYFWNKFWTFKKKEGAGAVEFGQFIAVSLVGLGVNVGIASLLVNGIGAPGDISNKLWVNVAAIAAIGFSTIWNFVGYKMFVFRKK